MVMEKRLRYRLWYKKTLKKTGKPLMVQDLLHGITYSTDKFEFVDCDIKMSFNNSVGESKACGATTVLEVYI